MSNTPKLRFKEFSGDWEKKKLGEMGQSIIGLTYSPDDISEIGTLVLRSSNIKNNKIVYMDNVFVNMEIPQKIMTQENDVLICSRNGSRHLIGKSALIDKCSKDNSFGAFMTIFRSDCGKFIFQLLQNENFFRQIHKNLGATINQITSKDLNSMKFYIPSLEEQEKIASFFSLIDKKISLQGEKVEALKDYKKGMMQKIFSKELRFKDDNGKDYPEWEEKKLGDITDIGTGSNDLQDKVEGGLYPFFVRSANIERINNYTFDGEAILIPGDGNIGQIYHYINGKFAYHQRVYKISDFIDGVSGKYIYYYMSRFFLKEALKNSVKATVDSLRLPTLTRMNILLPCMDEQKKITQLLSNIETKVEKEQEKLDSLNEYKKGLLQQMFV